MTAEEELQRLKVRFARWSRVIRNESDRCERITTGNLSHHLPGIRYSLYLLADEIDILTTTKGAEDVEQNS